MIDISMVIPLKDEEESLLELTQWIHRVMQKHDFKYEIIFIDDGSMDNSWQIIQQLHKKNSDCIKGIKFQRNYGKSAALYSGFKIATGEIVITMDADLQDSPDEIPSLFNMIKEQNLDIVSGWKQKRHDPLSKTIPTKLFNGVTRWMSGIALHDFNCGLKAYRLKVVKNIDLIGEMHRYTPVLAKWVGFKRIGEKVVTHYPRKYGKTKFGMERFVNGFLDLLTIFFISRFSKRPMHFFGFLGILCFGIGFISSVYLLYTKIFVPQYLYEPLAQRPSFYFSLTIMIIGIQLFLTGFITEILIRNSTSKHAYLIENTL